MNTPLDGPTPMTPVESADALNMKLLELCECNLDTQGSCLYCWCRQELTARNHYKRLLAEAVRALELIMRARRNPDIALTDMSRAGMRELAGEALSRIKAAGYVQEKPKCSCQEFAKPTCPVHR